MPIWWTHNEIARTGPGSIVTGVGPSQLNVNNIIMVQQSITSCFNVN